MYVWLKSKPGNCSIWRRTALNAPSEPTMRSAVVSAISFVCWLLNQVTKSSLPIHAHCSCSLILTRGMSMSSVVTSLRPISCWNAYEYSDIFPLLQFERKNLMTTVSCFSRKFLLRVNGRRTNTVKCTSTFIRIERKKIILFVCDVPWKTILRWTLTWNKTMRICYLPLRRTSFKCLRPTE